MAVRILSCQPELVGIFSEKHKKKHAAEPTHKYVLKTDISNCFGAINQHILVNNLKAAGLAPDLADRLEVLLTAYTGDRSSRGILQGIQPSDLFGNFYLNAVDTFLSDANVKSARYVDDIYVFLENASAGEIIVRDIIQFLRSYDLSLQESKSLLMPTAHLPSEEPDLVDLFAKAVEEISSQIDEADFDIDYGFQTSWDDEPEEVAKIENDDDEEQPTQLELAATISLFESVDTYPDQQENIERFCLPLFTKASSDYAVVKVMENFHKFPALSQIYCTYLVKFIDQENVQSFLTDRLTDKSLLDWQAMWVVAALHALKSAPDHIVKAANDVLKDANRHESLRAAAAMFVGRFGDHVRRKALMNSYAAIGSPYIQAAIYFSSMKFPAADKANAKNMWAEQTELNKLITAAMKASKTA